MTTFRFIIAGIDRLPSAGVAVISGTVVAGEVVVGTDLVLMHEGEQLPLRVTGVALGTLQSALQGPDGLTLCAELGQPAIAVARPGDELLGS